jgi:hypothetical protein
MRNHFEFDHQLSWTKIYFVSDDYIMPEWKPPDPKVLMLPPPKRFLKEHSVFNTSPDTMYMFTTDSQNTKANRCTVHVFKVRIYEQPGKLQLIKSKYFFDRYHNMMREEKQGFKVITYLPDKRALYIIKNEPVGFVKKLSGYVPKRYKRTMKRVSLNHAHFVGLESFPDNYVKRWSNAVFDAVRRDVPDVCDDAKSLRYRLIAFMIQHRVGRGIPGLNHTLLENLSSVVTQKFAAHIVGRQLPDHEPVNLTVGEVSPEVLKAANNLKKRTVYKFLPVLKKTGSTNKAFQALFGKYYFKTLSKIMTQFSFGMPSEDIAEFVSRYDDDVPTTIKHMLTKCINNEPCLKNNGSGNTRRNTNTMWLIKATLNMLADTNHVESHVINNWARTMLRLKQKIDWYLWRDMYDMSITVGRRVRPAQFNTMAEIEALHNHFNHLISNMDIPVSGVPSELLTFLRADIPSTFKDGKYLIKQLVTHAELKAESQAMNHCVESYSHKCASGKSVIISLQDKHGNRLYTLEYSGNTFKYMHGEGQVIDGVRPAPSPLEVDNIIRPLGAEITKREASKPLNYQIRAKLLLHKQKMWYDVEQLEYFPDWIQRGLKCTLANDVNSARILERCNRNIERLIEIDKMIANDVNGEVIINKINEIEQSKDTRVWTSGNMAPLPPAPAAGIAPPVTMDMANHIEECMTAATLWDHHLEDEVEQYLVVNDNQVPF